VNSKKKTREKTKKKDCRKTINQTSKITNFSFLLTKHNSLDSCVAIVKNKIQQSFKSAIKLFSIYFTPSLTQQQQKIPLPETKDDIFTRLTDFCVAHYKPKKKNEVKHVKERKLERERRTHIVNILS
jgi:hypothetical protein